MANEAVQSLVIIGLGNPGRKYAYTRHNLGFMVVEELARQLDLSFKADGYLNSLIAKGKSGRQAVDLLLPQTFMNESGWTVRRYLDYYKMTAAQVIVVCDDTALKFGQLRIRSQGSSGGHNGLKSISMYLGTHEFIRLKMGVGSNEVGQPLADYVLSNFNSAETAVLDEFVKNGVAALKLLMTEPLTQVMNRVNIKLTL
ncbi:MAG TPA: aminoacyl-tRNA hydrolase [Parachlamydiaceae bacterium]|nr:aminoacyl-tRNA hydrolase [Parachlamydiaceae bacterium]